MALLRLIVVLFLLCSVVYLCVSWYSRSVRHEKLEKEWDEDHPDGGSKTERQTFITQGMIDYNDSIRPKLLLLIYVVPAIFVGAILYITNAN
jgi:Ca2+/Na+ antiporter